MRRAGLSRDTPGSSLRDNWAMAKSRSWSRKAGPTRKSAPM
jgi:hypothetical protein